MTVDRRPKLETIATSLYRRRYYQRSFIVQSTLSKDNYPKIRVIRPDQRNSFLSKNHFNYLRKMLVFQCVNFIRDVFVAVCVLYDAFCLKNNVAIVIVFIYKMDGDSAFGLAGCTHGFVHVVAIHPFPSELRKKGLSAGIRQGQLRQSDSPAIIPKFLHLSQNLLF